MPQRTSGELSVPPVSTVVSSRSDSRPASRERFKTPALAPYVSLSEVLSALSHALDLTEGQPLGHTVRSCVIGMRLAESLELGAGERSALYYALLLKDAGCSSNAARMSALFGSDDRRVKPSMKFVDWHKRVRLALQTAKNCALGDSLFERVRCFVAIARTEGMTRDLIKVRCERGADIARQLGFPEATAAAIRSLDEHWCGRGYAEGLEQEQIPLLARIAGLAQAIEIFHARDGVERALQVVAQRRGSWFDPKLVDIVVAWKKDMWWWNSLKSETAYEMVLAAEPEDETRYVDADGLDRVARAFAEIIDTKSPFTYRHSIAVADYAKAIATRMNLDDEAIRQLYRASLLHDIGKLGVSSRILEKAGPLTPEERTQMQEHPVHTMAILERVSAFRRFARVAAFHHEKLDGSGYPWRLQASELDQPARILAVADVYDALTAGRPYREPMPPGDALMFLRSQRGAKLDALAVDALEAGIRAG